MSGVVPFRSVKSTSFACPHCGAHANQTWSEVYIRKVPGDSRLPYIADESGVKLFTQKVKTAADRGKADDIAEQEKHLALVRQLAAGELVVEQVSSPYVDARLWNLYSSRCYTCSRLAIWLHDRMIYPLDRTGAAPNQDLPSDVMADFDEARTIVSMSPRGAAALLRLAVQKLCAHLGEKGENINEDVAALVRKGLNPVVQKALDAVRVIGNEAVHPGQMDVKDDRDTVEELFTLVNFIAEQMITQPKNVQAIFDKLPESKREGIKQRDANV